jgi:hypothetical protein
VRVVRRRLRLIWRPGDDHAELNQPDQDDRPEQSEDDGIGLRCGTGWRWEK